MLGMFSRPRLAMVLLTVGVVTGMVILALVRFSSPAITTSPSPTATKVWGKITPRLRQAEIDGAEVGEQYLQRINDFFSEKHQHVGAFADELLGWGGKWAFVKGKLFGDDGQGHQEFLRKSFEQHIFTNDDLQNLLQGTIAGFISELEGRENALLVSIRADLNEEDLPALRSLAAIQSDEAFRSEYRKMLAEVMPVVSRDLNITVGREAAVWVGSEVAAAVTLRIASAVAVRLGISGGILGSGVASGAATLGIGLVVGFVVDGAVDFLMRRAGYDPAGQIANQTSATLERIRVLLIEGDSAVPNNYLDLGQMQNEWSNPFSRDESQQSIDNLTAGNSVGLRQEINRLREIRNSFRDAALKKLLGAGAAQ